MKMWTFGLPMNLVLRVIRGPENDGIKREEKILERLGQAILDVIDNPVSTQRTAAIGMLS